MADDQHDQHGQHGSESLADVERLLGALRAEDLERMPPPPATWGGIERRLASPAPDSVGRGDELAARRGRRSAGWTYLAAAAVVIVAVGAVFVMAGDDSTDPVAAVADLAFRDGEFDPLGASARATAELVERDGAFEVVLVDTDLPSPVAPDEDLELWLIAPDADGQVADLVSLGLVGAGTTFTVPDGYDPAEFSVVDISVEPRDGDAAHSGRSILRGPFHSA